MNIKDTKKNNSIDLKRVERLASESAHLAQRSLAKSDELQAYLSLSEFREGKKNTYKSPRDLFKKLKLA